MRFDRGRAVIRRVTFGILLSASVLIPLLTGPAEAQVVSPMQGGHYSAGVINIRDMAYPPSGLFVLWYNMFVSTDTYVDRNGNELNSLRLSAIHPALPDIDVDLKADAYTTVPALYYGSSFSLLGGARYIAGISTSYLSADALVVTERGSIIADTTITRAASVSVSGFSDLFVMPLGLSWSFEKLDVSAFYGFYAPVGRYEAGADDNTGLGFWTHQFQGFGYYYPFPQKATAVMLGLTYELNGKIKDSDVTPGSRLSLEWGVSQYLSEKFEVGVQGGHNWQVGDDTGDGVYWDAGVHDRKNTVGFSAGYWIVPEWLYVSGRYMFDFGLRQRFKNDCWAVDVILLTNVLGGK